MLPDYGRYYGSALIQIVERFSKPVTVSRLNVGVQGCYLLNGKVPIYFKFSRNRKGPWGFTFTRDHQVQYQRVAREHGECVLALVCGKDGIVALNFSQVREVLDDQLDEQEGISVRRKLKHMYSVGGTNGKLSGKVARDSLVQLLSKLLGEEVDPSALVNQNGENEEDGPEQSDSDALADV